MRSRKDIQRQVTDGLNLSFDPSISLTLYFRACERLLRECQTAQAESDHEQAYFVLLRLIELVMNYIPRHPAARSPKYSSHLKKWRLALPKLLSDLTVLKAVLDADYEAYMTTMRSERELKAKQDAALRAKRAEAERTYEHKLRRDSQAVRGKTEPIIDHEDIERRLALLRVDLEPRRESNRVPPPRKYDYPDLNKTVPSAPVPQSLPSSSSPTRPQKVPDVPRKVSIDENPPAPVAPTPEYQFSPSAQLENGQPLKTVFVPASLRSAFLKLAEPNTSRNLETCGILSGQLKNGAYFVTTLIVPAQASTSDTCHTTDEEGLFNYQDANDLFTLGWIHTHPSQTCFLSSVDVHTHCSYQIMLPEAIAIVLAPSKRPDWGAFRLTDPPGMKAIKECRQTGLFHPHEETEIYVDAVSDVERREAGHMKELHGMSFKVVDQRK